MNVLIPIENNLPSSISLRYICRQSQKVPMFIQPIHVEEPTQKHYQFGAGWVRKTWEKTLVNTTKDKIETFVKTEADNCKGITKVKIVVGDKEKEILKELEGGFYDLCVIGHLSSFDCSFFYDTLKSSFIKKMTCPVLIVKNLTKFEKVHLVLDSEMNLEKFILSYIKLYKNVPVKIYLVQYNFLETREVIINKAPSSDLLDRAKSLLAKEGISTTELLEISGLPENVAEKLKESGMVVSMFNRKGRRRPITDIMACTLSPILIFWD
ncbi:hypothetical protein JCM13304A_13190 [Desulfothermus okinawensis JCM 13304]